MDRETAIWRATDNEKIARQLCEQQPGFGTPDYRGDPMQAVAHQQLAERYRLAAAEITLDGRPAQIINVHARFAKVISLDGRHRGEWNWPTAARIVAEQGGEFRL